MQQLLISSGKSGDPAYLKHYIRSFPGHVPDAVEQYMKDKNINYRGLSLAQLHSYILETWQEHAWRKESAKTSSVIKICIHHLFVRMLQRCQIGDVVHTIEVI